MRQGHSFPPVTAAVRFLTISALTLPLLACGKGMTAPTGGSSAQTAVLVATFDENPVPFKSTGCNAAIPQGWYTSAQIRETAGVSFTANTFTQKLDGAVSSLLNESFNSRFGACAGGAFTEGMIPASGSVCGVVGVCTSSTFATYQFELAGTDANGHTLTFASPLLQFGSRPAGQSISRFRSPLPSLRPDAGWPNTAAATSGPPARQW